MNDNPSTPKTQDASDKPFRPLLWLIVLVLLAVGKGVMTPRWQSATGIHFEEQRLVETTTSKLFNLKQLAEDALTRPVFPLTGVVEKEKNYVSLLERFQGTPFGDPKTFALVLSDSGWWVGYRLRGDLSLSMEGKRRRALAANAFDSFFSYGMSRLYGSPNLQQPPNSRSETFLYVEKDDVVWAPLSETVPVPAASELRTSVSEPGFISPDIAVPASVLVVFPDFPELLQEGLHYPSPYPHRGDGSPPPSPVNIGEFLSVAGQENPDLYARNISPTSGGIIFSGKLNNRDNIELLYLAEEYRSNIGRPSGFVLRVVPNTEESPQWERFDTYYPYERYPDFRNALPKPCFLPQRVTVEDGGRLLSVLDAFWPIPLPLKRELVNLLEDSYAHPSERDVEERVLFQWFRKGYGHMVWRVTVAPDYIACFTDGGIYDLASPDMADRLLVE